ncbi:MAG: MMPL family transporter [Actinomycetota bacterium]|nr:MMPL family transporter [Actinomycetota bacterium]
MLVWICTTALRRRRALAVAIAALVPVLALLGGGVADRLSVGGRADPGAESVRGAEVLEETFAAGPSNLVMTAEAVEGRVEDPANVAAGTALTERLGEVAGVVEVTSFWSTQAVVADEANPLRSADGRTAIVSARLAGGEAEQQGTVEAVAELAVEFSDVAAPDLEAPALDAPALDVKVGGAAEVGRSAAERAEKDLHVAELIATPITLAALFFVFRGWRAAVLPLIVAALAVLATFVVLSGLSTVFEINVLALNLTTALGLGLSIDYALLIVARYREELAAGRSEHSALVRTMQTAGRTVLFSGATVAASLVALLVFPVPYLRSFAFAGVAVVATACAATLLVAPVLLASWGRRLGTARAGADSEGGGGFWTVQTRRVVRRPIPWLVAVMAVLIVAGLPFLGIEPGNLGDRVLPTDDPARQVAETIRTDFDPAALDPVAVVAPDVAPADVAGVSAIEATILATPGVARVDGVLGTATAEGRLPPGPAAARFRSADDITTDGTWFEVTLADGPETSEANDTVRRLRTNLDAFDGELLVTGSTAATVDAVDGVTSRLPLALGVIALVTLALLFLMTGSVVVPLKALVLNLFSLTATFGALVWVFQDGHLAGLLGVTATGSLDTFTPVLMFCIAFGLSMDYEVFLLSRIKEEYDLGGDNDAAVISGIGHTGRLVTAAAVLLSIVFVSIATGTTAPVKMTGVGLTIAVLTDAFGVRATLTPALMKLAGRANWWAPRPLRMFHLRWGLWEHEPLLLPDQPGHGATSGGQAPDTVADRAPAASGDVDDAWIGAHHDGALHDGALNDDARHEGTAGAGHAHDPRATVRVSAPPSDHPSTPVPTGADR